MQRGLFLFCIISFTLPIFAQNSNYSKYRQPGELYAYNIAYPYFLVQWKPGVTIPTQNIVRQLDQNSAILIVEDDDHFKYLQKTATIHPANNEWKLSPLAVGSEQKNIKSDMDFILTGRTSIPREKLAAVNHLTIKSIDEQSHSVVVHTSWKVMRQHVLQLPEIIFVDICEVPYPEIAIIGYNRSFHGINALDYKIPGADGKNIVVGIKEQKMESLDLDLFKRVLPSSLEAASVTNHATVISSIIGGAGNSFYDGRGIAHHCNFFSSSFSNLFPDDIAKLNATRVTAQNHSYGTIIQPFYGAEAVSYDIQTWENKNMVHVFSAGNQGTASPGAGPYNGINGFSNLTGNFKMAKNIITVGAIDNKGTVAPESSAGPVYDGRIAPQLTALGPNGTSDAAAMVSGTVAVLQQVYADSNSNAIPAASLVKALLYNNADDIFNTHIDYKTGYGLLNSYESVRALQKNWYSGSTIENGQQWTLPLTIPTQCAQLKVTVCWTDSASLPNNNKALVNDLDLEVVDISRGTVYKPWVLNAAPHPDSLFKVPIRKRDSLNTAEQISIQLPAPGIYQVRVNGYQIQGSPVPFHIAYRVDTLNTFHFINPQHSSDINREENPDLDIKWRTFVPDTNTTGNLSVSYDAGQNWQTIQNGFKIYKNAYSWAVKDTSSRALFKMETGFGNFYSNEVIITKTTQLKVDFLCTDSFRLSWNKHIYANNYTLYSLTDSPYLKPVLSVADSFIVLNRAAYPSLVYAVQPNPVNGLPASRSIALDISLQGVQCFYRTLYYTLFDENKLELTLELSAPGYTDSVTFEQVSSNGNIIRSFERIKTGTGLIYSQLVDELPGGTSYWRVRIKLKSGAVVFTEIISVISSGKSYVLFYPNPGRRGDPLQFVVKQGLPVDSRLQIFDATGRMISEITELSITINTNNLPEGLLIYRLVARNGEVLQTGKLLLLQ